MPVDREIDHLMRRVAELEDRVSRLERDRGDASGFGSPPPDPLQPSAHVRGLLATGSKIEAIHAYRQESGASLKEAKRRIDSLEA